MKTLAETGTRIKRAPEQDSVSRNEEEVLYDIPPSPDSSVVISIIHAYTFVWIYAALAKGEARAFLRSDDLDPKSITDARTRAIAEAHRKQAAGIFPVQTNGKTCF